MELLGEIKYWNNTDIECFDDTTPTVRRGRRVPGSQRR